MGRKSEKRFEPINDDIDTEAEEKVEESMGVGIQSMSGVDVNELPTVKGPEDVLDMAPIEVPTLAEVKRAEEIADDMQRFFDMDDHFRLCEEALEKAREDLCKSFVLEETKQGSLWENHLKWLHYGEAKNIMRDTHRKEASRLRALWEESKKGIAEVPLIDAAEAAGRDMITKETIVGDNEDGGLDGDGDEGDLEPDLADIKA